MTPKAVAVGMLLGSALALFGLIVGSASQAACYPWADAMRVEPLTCHNGTGHNNPTWKVQTISEMTARTGLTAELLSGFAAVSLIAIYNALCYMKKHMYGHREYWHLVDATFAVGALGFVGLTVWNLRVESTVHTCFTSQAIMAVFIQVATLTSMLTAPRTENWVCLSVMGLAMLEYVVLFSVYPEPDPGSSEYFDAKYYAHAWGQFTFFGTYFIALALLTWHQCGPKALGHAREGKEDDMENVPHLGSTRRHSYAALQL